MSKNSISKNFLFNTLYTVTKIIFPLLVTPYLSRILLAEGIGRVSYANNIVTWFLLFASLGIPRYGVREIARNKENKEELNVTFTSLFSVNAISSVIFASIFYFFCCYLNFFGNELTLYCVTGLQLILNIFNVDWFYQGMEQFSYITKRSLCIKLISLLLILLFVKNKEDYVVYALIQSIALAGNNIINYFHLHKYVCFNLEKKNIKKHIKPIFMLFSTQFAINVYALLDTTMLGYWCEMKYVGYYSNAHKIILLLSTLCVSLGSVLLPRFTKYVEHEEFVNASSLASKALEVMLFFSVPIFLGVVCMADDIVVILFGSDFESAIGTLRILSFFIVITTIGNLFGTQLLMALNQEKKLLYSVLAGALANLLLNLLLIRVLKNDGVALASIITELIVMIYQVYAVKKTKIQVRCKKSFIFSLAIMNLSLLVVIMILRMVLSQHILVRDTVIVVVGGTIYLVVGHVTKNDVIQLVVTKLKVLFGMNR